MKYYININKFEKYSVEDIIKFQENEENFFLYTGRISCPHCRIFIPKLNHAIKKHDLYKYIKVLDSSDYKTNELLISFREKYRIPTVPSLVYFSGKQKISELDINDNISTEEIFNYINSNK